MSPALEQDRETFCLQKSPGRPEVMKALGRERQKEPNRLRFNGNGGMKQEGRGIK